MTKARDICERRRVYCTLNITISSMSFLSSDFTLASDGTFGLLMEDDSTPPFNLKVFLTLSDDDWERVDWNSNQDLHLEKTDWAAPICPALNNSYYWTMISIMQELDILPAAPRDSSSKRSQPPILQE